jgi:heptosyltransferase II
MDSVIPEGATWVRFPRFLGDAAMQLPVLRILRQLGIGPLVAWGPRTTVALVQDHELADAVLPDEGQPGPWAMAATLRRFKAARSIHFPKSLRPALAAWLARIPERLGVDESGQGIFNTHSGPFWKAEGPFLLRYHAVLASRWPSLPPMPFADYDPGVQVDRPPGPYLSLMPGSTWPSKAWPQEHYLSLARLALGAGLAVVVLGVPEEDATCAFVAHGGGRDLCGQTSLKEAAAWLRGAWAAVGNDSGLSHLAAACGTPTLAIYGATDPGGSTPWGPRSRALRRDGVPCSPCFKRDCTVPGHPCLQEIGPEQVWAELQALISA